MSKNRIITATMTFENLTDSQIRTKECECRGLGWDYTIHKPNGVTIECKIRIPKTNIPC